MSVCQKLLLAMPDTIFIPTTITKMSCTMYTYPPLFLPSEGTPQTAEALPVSFWSWVDGLRSMKMVGLSSPGGGLSM